MNNERAIKFIELLDNNTPFCKIRNRDLRGCDLYYKRLIMMYLLKYDIKANEVII